MAKKVKKLTPHDVKTLSCTFDSNFLAARIRRDVEIFRTGISGFDISIVDDKKLAKQLIQLGKLLDKAAEVAGAITDKYYQTLQAR